MTVSFPPALLLLIGALLLPLCRGGLRTAVLLGLPLLALAAAWGVPDGTAGVGAADGRFPPARYPAVISPPR